MPLSRDYGLRATERQDLSLLLCGSTPVPAVAGVAQLGRLGVPLWRGYQVALGAGTGIACDLVWSYFRLSSLDRLDDDGGIPPA